MPKRKNPFGEYTQLQCKTHVGFEQMATEEERQAVFEKTKALLFQGANGRSNGDAALPPAGSIRDNHSRVHSFDRDSSTKSHIARNNGSTETVSTGSREQTGLLDYFTSSGGATGGGGKSGVGGECSGCKGRQREVWSCAHCEGVMCGECSRQCLHCQGTFCSNCSVLNYDEIHLRSFCLNCLP